MTEPAKTIGDGNGSEQEVKEITYTKQELEAMTPTEVNNLLMLATKIEGTAVVRRADGSIKYDDVTLAGTFGE